MKTPVAQPVVERTAIDAQGLHKSFRKTVAVDEINLAIQAGQIFGLVGPDGSGKSTILNIFSGLLHPDKGTCIVFGHDVLADPEAIRPTLGFMPQGLGLALSSKLTVRQNLDFFADLYHIPHNVAAERADQLLRITDLHAFQDRLAGHLSGGMKQKLALCCTLVHHPRLLILDEPTTGIDPVSRRELWMILNDLVCAEGMTVVIATSYLDEAERCHHVALVHRGRILLEGTPVDLPARYGCSSLQQLFVEQLEPMADHHFRPESLAPAARITRRPVNPDEPVIQVDGLIKRFGHFTAVDQISFEIYPGTMFGFLGPNGAGKTTAIKMLCGILPPTAGDARVAGCHVLHQRKRLKKRIGYMSQAFSLYRDLRVIENLNLYRSVYRRRSHDVLDANDLLEMVGLTGRETRLTGDLPVGLKQRLALACSMVHLPEVLFLDEPTSGVDPLARERFWDIVRFLSRQFGITVLLTTHYMDEAEFCDRLAMINYGRLVAVGTPEELKKQTEREKGVLIEVICSNYQLAKTLIDEKIAPAVFFGRRLHIFSRDPHDQIRQIMELLKSAGLDDATAKPIPIRLEDVFIHFARKEHPTES